MAQKATSLQPLIKTTDVDGDHPQLSCQKLRESCMVACSQVDTTLTCTMVTAGPFPVAVSQRDGTGRTMDDPCSSSKQIFTFIKMKSLNLWFWLSNARNSEDRIVYRITAQRLNQLEKMRQTKLNNMWTKLIIYGTYPTAISSSNKQHWRKGEELLSM